MRRMRTYESRLPIHYGDNIFYSNPQPNSSVKLSPGIIAIYLIIGPRYILALSTL